MSRPCSALFSDTAAPSWPRTQPQGPLLAPHRSTPERSLPAASVTGTCPSLEDTVMFRSCCRPPPADIITMALKLPVHGAKKSMLCDVSHLPRAPDQAHAGPHSPAASGFCGRNHSSSCQRGREALPPLLNRLFRAGSVTRPFTKAACSRANRVPKSVLIC